MSATHFLLADYFGTTERPIIHETFLPVDGWQSADGDPVTHLSLIALARVGYTRVALKLGTRIADFNIGELSPCGIFVTDPLEGLR